MFTFITHLTMKKLFVFLSMAGSLTFNLANAQTAIPDSVTKNFIIQATAGGLKETESGTLAVSKAQSKSVKSFGAKMIADHTKANNQLAAIVKSKGYQVSPPSDSDTDPGAMLKNSTGAEFDKNYVSMMVMDHKKTVQLFQDASTNVPDAEVKAFAAQTLPIVKQHLVAIQAIASKMGISDK